MLSNMLVANFVRIIYTCTICGMLPTHDQHPRAHGGSSHAHILPSLLLLRFKVRVVVVAFQSHDHVAVVNVVDLNANLTRDKVHLEPESHHAIATETKEALLVLPTELKLTHLAAAGLHAVQLPCAIEPIKQCLSSSLHCTHSTRRHRQLALQLRSAFLHNTFHL